MTARIEFEPDFRERVLGAVDEVFLGKLGPAIVADERRYAPVDTGHLAESCEPPRLGGGDGHDLIIENSAEYARWVEMGHMTPTHFDGHPAVNPPHWVDAQPFLRPAVWQERSG